MEISRQFQVKMGFPLGHVDLLLPQPLLHLVSVFSSISKLLSIVLAFVGLGSPHFSAPPRRSLLRRAQRYKPPSAVLIEKILPAVPYTPGRLDERESCAVCLCRFGEGQEVRWLRNCPHVFHGRCIDPWVELGRRSCPLCRAPLVPHELRDVFCRGTSTSTSAASSREILGDEDGDLYLLGDPFTFLLDS